MIVKEIKIAVPWGHIAAKIWGDACNSKILMVHGILDNAESFSGLIQLLPQSFHYVVVDLPGHGKSSHFPKNIIVNYWNYILAIRLVVRFLNETPIILLGHSFGGSLLTVYTQLYPNEVSKLILIDGVYLLYIFEVEVFKNYMKRYIRQACDMLTQIATYRTFTYDEGLDLFTTKRLFGTVSSESAAHIYERNIVSGNSGLISHFVNLQIVIPEAHIQGSGSGEHHVDKGSIINLVCIIDKSPTPPQYVFWYHNNNMINYDTNRGGINVETLPGHPTQSRLTITDTHEADSGNYTCSASNTEPAFVYVYVSEGDNVDAILMRKSCGMCVASQLILLLIPSMAAAMR
ncbi:hypothetical protein RI129_004045 [Pyrocoelia pectoralis]|uniref:Ig-like domain-containing protein n=1 Tax=Pyrocoelia pectoralis TaxID=417401 RepID=A0AAN7VTM2_9COLE